MARRRPPAPIPTDPAADDAPLPRWVEGMMARGKITEAEYRERARERRERHRQEYIRLVPPAVENEGPEAVEEWADEMVDHRDPRLFLADKRGPRDPLSPAEAFRRDESRRR